tara:strand:- start:183 stop:1067 length:885 start_codon:yes stop_codon:yes gene_type:complete
MIYKICKYTLLFILIVIYSYKTFASEKDLKNFKKDFYYQNKKIKNVKFRHKSRNVDEVNLDESINALTELNIYIEDQVRKDNIDEALISMDLLDFMYKEINTKFPKRYKLNLEELNLSAFSNDELVQLQIILNDLEKSKINNFKSALSVVTQMKNTDFNIGNFLIKMSEFGISIKPPAGTSLDFDLTNFSSENLDQINNNMSELEDQLAKIDLDSLNENISNLDVSALSAALAELDTSVIADNIGDVSNEVGDYISASSNNSSGIIWAQTCTGDVCVEMDNPTDAWLEEHGFND